MTTKIKTVAVCIALIFLLGACKKWIDVKPSDRLAEDELFSTTSGYLTALNGVYVELTNPSIYGEHMTVSSLDVMSGYYYVTLDQHRSLNFATFNYAGDTAQKIFDNMWKKSYALIVNCNVILEHCGDNSNPLLPAPYFGLVKGEALALRAMLHLDMLRVFGPIYSTANKDIPCIPYNTGSRPQVTALLGSAVIMQNIINDLTAAAALLKDADPIITSGVRDAPSPTGDNSLYYRQYRLNYYAVKALLARAYLWMQDKQNALQQAKEVITAVTDSVKPIFKIGVASTTAVPADWDHLFSSEVMFGLYVNNRQNVYTNLFSPDVVNTTRLPFNNNDANPARRDELYNEINDYRLKAWVIQTNATGTFLTHIKFSVPGKAPDPNMMPLIRLSELLLMAAECSSAIEDGTKYLNILRNSRSCVSLTPTTADQLKDYITKEFRKEVIGEGQMFFYYKRNASALIPNTAAVTGTKQMLPANYVVPLPVSEISVRGK